jgi:membrane dipeptidase
MEGKDRRGWSRRGLLAAAAGMAVAGPASARASRRARYVDGLSFLPKDMGDVTAAGLDAFICDVSEVEEVKDPDGLVRYLRTFAACDKSMDEALARIETSPEVFLARKGSDVGSRPGAAVFLQFQSCEPLEADLSRIASFHAKGLRVLQITHHNDNLIGGGSLEPKPHGLTRLGFDAVAEMNRVGVIADVSHASEKTALDVARTTRAPFILSHGACRAIVDNPRCASDAMIRAVADRGGVMGVFMMSFWLTTAPVPTTDHYLAHIAHVVRVGGIDAVGVANDFSMAGQENLTALHNDNAEGVKEYLDWWEGVRRRGVPGFETPPRHVVIPELNDIHRMSSIHRALDRAGYRDGQIEKIMGGNWIRVLTDSLG